MAGKHGYKIDVLLIAVFWVPFSFFVALLLVAWIGDPPPQQPEPDPYLLKAFYEVVNFPMKELKPWDWMQVHLSEGKAIMLAIFGTFINGLFWGTTIVFLFRHLVPILRREAQENTDAG